MAVFLVAGILAGAAAGTARAASAAAQLAPDARPILVLEPPPGPLLLVHAARRGPLPSAWRTSEADRGFNQALLMQLSQSATNWPWRTLVVSSSGPQSDSQLQTQVGGDAVVAVLRAELVDLEGKVEYHLRMELTTVRAIATSHESRVVERVEYVARPLAADSARPRRSVAHFVMDGALDAQVSTAATDLSQFLAMIVARVSVPESLHPHNPTLKELGVHPSCGECRPSDPVVYRQPGRVWVRVGRPPGSILAVPLHPARIGQSHAGH